MKKVVVTGALGFIGFSLCNRLLEKGFEVIGIDGMIDKNMRELYEEKLLWFGRNTLFQFIDKKIEDIDLDDTFAKVDTVYHLAAATRREGHWSGLRTKIEDNVELTGKVISACNENKKLIFTSSTQVYGERTGIITEKTPLNPITPDSITKMAAELLIKSRYSEQSVPYMIFRLPTIYGPWQRTDTTYSQLIVNDLKSLKTNVESDHITEDVLYIDDILDTLIAAGFKKTYKNEIYNLSTGKFNEWYRGKAIITNERYTLPKDERMQIVISNEKVTNHFGFKSCTDLKTGIEAQKIHIKKYQQHYLK